MRRYVVGLVLLDAAVAVVAAVAAGQLRFGGDSPPLADPQYASLVVLLPLAWIAALSLHRGYDPRLLFVGGEEYQRVLRAGVTVTAGIAVAAYTVQADVARGALLAAVLATVVLDVVGRYLLRQRLRRAWAAGRHLRRVLVVGHDRSVAAMARQLRHERYHGLGVVGACLPPTDPAGDPPPARVTGTDLRVFGSFEEVPAAVRCCQADVVVVLASPELDGVALRRLAWQLERDRIELIVASALLDVTGERATLRPVDGLPMLHVEHPRLTGARRMVKTVADRVGAALLLLLLAPLLAVIALAVRLDRRAPGPAIFRQVRVGRDGAEFRIWKFRTMHVDAEARLASVRHLNQHDGVLFKLRDDPRVTPIGRVLRRFSLDELPQLVNVVRGEMSLVGPRPGLPAEVAEYPSDMRRRLVVKPGVTGLWQVSGRADLTWAESMRLDLRYVENWSLTLDLVILLRTVTAVLRRSGAY
ncbi:sugar transferase [Natronosporangium hydrolyticum]|uniref:Sugar transferase n=1 Tax=Natronosporangium hydrolyticum TaxID=2811111 RepID=A0A895YSN7_9ACTN|nr:sugar transferase [Natronosporangium hydrolyticum]QSB17130.1 sugar transferase [Natronosporangium hydrolyticum]